MPQTDRLMPIPHAVVTVGLEQSFYSVAEADRALQVCVEVTRGQLAPGVTVETMLSTADGGEV